MDVVDLQIDMIGKSFLGLTLACARCHDHKFDPIPQKDYYSVAGILASTQTLKGIMTDVFSDLNRVALAARPRPRPPRYERETAQYDAQFRELKSPRRFAGSSKAGERCGIGRASQGAVGKRRKVGRRTANEGGWGIESQLNELR